MKKMKKVVLALVSICMFWNCTKIESPRVGYYEGAAIVKDWKSGEPILEVLYDIILVAPGLSNENLEVGDLLWVKLFVEENKQTNEDTILVSNIIYKQIGSSLAKPATDVASDFTCPINKALMWHNHAGNNWVFGFEQIAPEGQTFDYEMQFAIEGDDTYPTLYLRSQKTNTVNGSNKQLFTNFGFDLTPLIEEYMDEDSNTLTFRVKYLSGFNADEEEIFTSFRQNPVVIKVEKSKELESTMGSVL
jgi:hypothetical protein